MLLGMPVLFGALFALGPLQQPAATGTSHDQLDKDHVHNAAASALQGAELGLR